MKRFRFNAFVIDGENREAFEACREVSRLDTADSRPIVLVGGHGCGKTHLMWAIAEEIRESSSRAGIVYVSTDKIPDSVRKLVKDPTPVDLAQQAVLLVDDLHRCTGDLRVLGEIVRIFLENDHQIIFASREPPDRLHSIPFEIGNALGKARVIEIGAGDVQRKVELIEGRIRQDTEEIIARQEQEIDDLRARLNTTYPAPGKAQGEAEAGLLRECVEELTADLSKAREQLTNAHLEVDELKAMAPVVSARPGEESDRPAGFEGARKTREEARMMLERAERLTEEMHEARAEFVRAQEDRTLQVSEIDKLERVYSQSGEDLNHSSRQSEDSLTREVEATLRAELDALRKEHDTQHRECERLEESVVRAHSERDTMKSLLEHLRNERDEARRDLDEARTESNEQAMARRMAAEKLMALHSQLLEGPVLLERLMELLGLPAADSDDFIAGRLRPDSDATETAPPPEFESDEQDSEISILRPDFGEGAHPIIHKSSTLHHVEELGPRPDLETGETTREEETQSERDQPQSRHQSA